MPPPTLPPAPPPEPPTQHVRVNFPPEQHVLVNVPHELVDRFTTHEWLTQPVATLIGAAGAIAAASIAFYAVNRQINANASIVSAQIAADRSDRRRAERVDLADDGATVVTELAQIAFSYEHLSGKTSLPQLEKEKFYRLEVLPMTRRMKLLGMPDTAEAVEDVYEHGRVVIDPLASDKAVAASTVEQKRDKALSTLKASLEQEATPPAVLKRKRKKTPASPKKP